MPAMRSKFSFTLFALLSTGLFACSDSTGTGPDLSGEWVLNSDISVPDYQITCSAEAELRIQQTAGATTIEGTITNGSFRCSGPGGTAEESGLSGRIQGSYTDNRVSFADDDGCVFEGTVSGHDSRMEGEVSCPDVEGADFSGTWTATLKQPD